MNIYVYNELEQKTELMFVENEEIEGNEIFADDSIRKVWHSGLEEWYLSIYDVVKVLTDSNDPKQYIKKMRARDKELDPKWGTICTPLQMLAPDGKMRKAQAANIEGILRVI